MPDIWLPRLLLIGQFAVLGVCGALIGLGHNSVILDLFIAGSGGLLASSALEKLRKPTTLP